MADIGELILKVSAEVSALEAALEKAQAGILVVLRRQYIAEGSPYGATAEGFDIWLAEREALITSSFDLARPYGREITLTSEPSDQLKTYLSQLGKAPPGSAEDCEFCHPELAAKE